MTRNSSSTGHPPERSRTIIAREAQNLRRTYRIRTLTIVATETETRFVHRFDDGETIWLG